MRSKEAGIIKPSARLKADTDELVMQHEPNSFTPSPETGGRGFFTVMAMRQQPWGGGAGKHGESRKFLFLTAAKSTLKNSPISVHFVH
jgi:hypothetical protein